MRLYLRMAWRNIWRHRRRTLIIVLAIGLTMWMMMWYDGIMAGFTQAIYGNAIKVLGGNIQVHAANYHDQISQPALLPLGNDQAVVKAVLAQPQVVGASRRINTNGLATNRKGAFGITITGIEPEKELPINLVAQHVVAGRYLTPNDQDMAFIGKGLADAMELNVGDRFTLAGRDVHDQMRTRTMTVAGIYDIGMPDVEKRTIYTSLTEAQDLYGLPGQATEVVVSLKQIGQEPAVIKSLQSSLPGYEMDSWQTNFPELQQTIEAKTTYMNYFSYFILFIVAIGILNLLLMAIMERTREIGVLAALGLKPRQILGSFLLEGIMMGLVGVVFGVALGLIFNFLTGRVGWDFSAFSGMTTYTALISGKIYPTLGMEKLVMRTVVVLVFSVLAAFIPAWLASRSEPAKALHYV
jgi:ABC-type lipoprotein release transport system permease subunit